MSADPLQRYLDAQEHVIDQVLRELRNGKKQTHWMWFIFPQLKGLGRSEMSYLYGLDSAEEASAYWAHPILGDRLRHCLAALLESNANTAVEVFGEIDALKFRSCLKLFQLLAPQDALLLQCEARLYRASCSRHAK